MGKSVKRTKRRAAAKGGGPKLGPLPSLRLKERLPLCDHCGRLARGFWYRHQEHPRFAEYAACSMACLDLITASAEENKGVAKLTQMEREAIKAARMPLWNALTHVGLGSAFADATAEQMDFVIQAVWDGVRESMQRQTLNDEIPF